VKAAYESRYVRANHPDRPLAIWIRATLLRPQDPRESGSAALWVMGFDGDSGATCGFKQTFPISAADFSRTDFRASIGETVLDDARFTGHAASLSHAADWALTITPGEAMPVHLLSPRLQAGWFPPAKTSVRSPLARFDGTFVLDGWRLDLDGWSGSVNHNWGSRHTPEYAYGQVCGFDDHPDSTLEIATARSRLGGVTLSPTTLMVLRHDGRELEIRTLLDARRSHGRYSPFVWSFAGRQGSLRVSGEMTAPSGDVLGLTYIDTDGATKYCYNSAIATCRLVLDSGRDRIELHATRRAMLELLLPRPAGNVPLTV
jgi:hypothetical protein